MVILLLFLGTFCVLFFLPVQFRIFYQKIAWDDTLALELSFLGGLLKMRRTVSLLQLTPRGLKKRETLSGRWLFLRKKQTKEDTSSIQGDSRIWREFLQRYQKFGVGVTLLTYFLPAKYQPWILVVEDLERRGCFKKFVWKTKFGTGEPVGTAIIYGILWGVKSSILSLLHRSAKFDPCNPPDIQIIADFGAAKLDFIFDCIFHVKLGYIIIAAFIARFRYRMMKGEGGIGIGESSN
ncbi:MAG TPA: hypothetical protein DDW65_01075 [Firmicutes bacterium]|nr:hypothetical protein [Bacillota bacterium]